MIPSQLLSRPSQLSLGLAPHAPQLPITLSGCSQPSAAAPLQSPKPVLHANRQALIEHTRVALARVGHTVPHALQLFGSLVVLTSQPSALEPLQFP